VRFLIDNALSPQLTEKLRAAGHDAHHVREHNMQYATDEAIFDLAAAENRILVSADTDFGTIVTLRRQRQLGCTPEVRQLAIVTLAVG